MLTTDFVHHKNLDRAAEELMANATRLALAGLADEAHEALVLLMSDGPWRLPARGHAVQKLSRLLPVVSMLASADCPAVGEETAIVAEQWGDWSQNQAHELIASLARVGRKQLKPAGLDWSPEFLATLPDRHRPGDDRPHAAFGGFCVDAEFVLKDRVAKRFGVSTTMVDMPAPEDLEALGLPASEVTQLLQQLRTAGLIELAEATAAIDTLDIALAAANYRLATGSKTGHTDQTVCLASWLLLVDEARHADAQTLAKIWLASDEEACARMIDAAVVPSVARHIQAKHLAGAFGIDAMAASRWFDTLRSRQSPAQAENAGDRPAPKQASETFETVIAGTPLAALKWLQVPVPDVGEHAWVAAAPVAQRKLLWEAGRRLVSRTGRWPVITTLWESTDPSDAGFLARALFDRFPYEQGASRDDFSPRSLIAAARCADLDEFINELAEREYPLPIDERIEIWKRELVDAPAIVDRMDAALAEMGDDTVRIERWLGDQEAAHGLADPELGRQPEFTPDNAWLVLLPSACSEDVLAYLHWYGMERGVAEGFIRLLAQWREQHGAELFAHYGTMLEFIVRKPPADLDTAFALAREHELVAPCTLQLPGIALRHYALGLVNHGQWFLHERP